MKKLPSKEIMDLKRTNYWLIRDRLQVKFAVQNEYKNISDLNGMINANNVFTITGKELVKNRNKRLDLLGLLSDLEIRIDRDIYENGKKIMKLRHGS